MPPKRRRQANVDEDASQQPAGTKRKTNNRKAAKGSTKTQSATFKAGTKTLPKQNSESSYTAAQKAAISNFVGFTNLDRTAAARYLKNYGWNVEQAVNGYYNSTPSSEQGGGRASSSALNKLFDKYRDDPQNAPDTIGMDGTMQYLQDLDVNIEDIGLLVVSELVQSPSMGEITREGFVNGWRQHGYDSIEKQKTYVASLLQGLPKNKDHFNRVYKFTFLFAKAADKKVIDLEVAIEFWRVLFGSDLSPTRWQTPESPFLDWWIEFLESKYKKAINKDTWEQTLKFADQCLKDESLKWWSEEAAWPGVVDEFVEYVMAKRPKEETEEMEVEY